MMSVWMVGALGLVAVCLLAVIALLWTRQRTTAATAAGVAALQHAMQTQMTTMASQMTQMSQTALPLSVALQTILIKELTHFHTPKTDALLAKLGPPFTLADAEEAELLVLLQQREQDMGDQITPEERDAAHILPVIIKRARWEMHNLETKQPVLFQLVMIPTVLPEASEPPADAVLP